MISFETFELVHSKLFPVADQDLELRRWGGVDLPALLAFLPSVISSFFTENKDPPLLFLLSALDDNLSQGVSKTSLFYLNRS